jgi:hypothetical protein
MTKRVWWLGAAFLALAFAAPMFGPGAAHAEAPVVVYQNLNEGDVLSEPPWVIQMCFSRPIDIRDQPDGGDWNFNMITPQGQGSAMRIVFQNDAYGVAMYPVTPPTLAAIPTNETNSWTYTYRVADKDSGDPLTGSLTFTISDDADAIPRATPPACVPAGGTGEATPPPTDPAATDTPGPTRTPAGGTATESSATNGSETPANGDSTTPTPPGDSTDDDDDDGGSDALVIVLIALGALGLVGGVGGLAYMLTKRRRGGPPAASA